MDSHGSGLLHGGGVRGARFRRNVAQGGSLRHFPDVHISDSWGIKRDVPDFDPDLEQEYSPRELLLLAEKMLLEDEKPSTEYPAWLSVERMKQRMKREVFVASGIPDPSVASGMYWRTHPRDDAGAPRLSEPLARTPSTGNEKGSLEGEPFP